MRTNIVIDDQLMKDAMWATDAKTKREAVEKALKTLIRLERNERVLRSGGNIKYDMERHIFYRVKEPKGRRAKPPGRASK